MSSDSQALAPKASCDTSSSKSGREYDVRIVFQDVIQNFQKSLGPKEKDLFKEFQSPEEMLQDLQSRCKEVRNGRKLSKICHMIKRFASAWEPFFEITSIFVQTHPEFAGIAWGAIRLVFLLGENYTVHLEKLVEMTQRIAEILPAYEEYFKLFMNRKKAVEEDSGSIFTLELRHHRLYKALSFVYADIIQFCQDACNLFSSKRGGTRYTPSLIADVFWKPFDSRFASLLDRMQTHRENFHTEMQLEESKFFEWQSEKRARQSTLNGEALEQIQMQAAELRKSNAELDMRLSSHVDHLLQEIRRNHPSGGYEAREKEVLSKVAQIKAWISAPPYMREYEKSCRTRLPETGEYLLDNPVYKEWRDGFVACEGPASRMETPALPNLLMLKGKPGFGKTILSSLLIEDLRSCSPVFFYHFSTERRDFSGPYDAIRAVLVQLVHCFSNKKDIIDQVAVLMDSDGSGQTTASDQEALASLSLILATAPQVFLIIDGIDECDNHVHFLELMRDISTAVSHKILLLGRPHVEVPAKFPHLSLHLDRSWNLPDIKLYLQPGLTSLQDRHLIPSTLDIDEITDNLALRAEGIFLWAWLMVQYLNCRALSPKERQDAIFTPSIVEGLEDVYEKIFRALDRGYQKEKDQILKIFEILTAALRPIYVSELEVAIGIVPGSVTNAFSIIVDFETTLPVLCGSLVEIGTDRTVRFVHSSFRDFITSQNERRSSGPFAVNERRAHLGLSTLSLSYIMYDLPSSSVCDAVSGTDAGHLTAELPFVAYALYWPRHAIQGLPATVSESAQVLEAEVEDAFFTLITKFLDCPLSITVWMETSWVFHAEPSLAALVDACSQTISPSSESFLETGSIAVTMLREFSSQLDDLNAEWRHLLRKDPQAIWGSSITAFSRSSYWFQTKLTIVSSLLPVEATGAYKRGSANRPILVQSQPSASGEYIGVVMVVPSRSYLVSQDLLSDDARRQPRGRVRPTLSDTKRNLVANICSAGWKVRVQRISAHDEKMLMDIEVELPEKQIFTMLQQSLTSETPHRLRIPVCFSHDLNRLVILDLILAIRWITPEDSSVPVPQWRQQCLERGNFSQSKHDSDFSITFAPNASALAFVSGHRNGGAMNCKRIQVWSNAAADDDWPRFVCKGEVMSSGLRAQGDTHHELFAFHPYLPLIAYSEWTSVVIWQYNEEHVKNRTLVKNAATSIDFAEDGRTVLYGWLEPTNKYEASSASSSQALTKSLDLNHLCDIECHSTYALIKQQTTPATVTADGAVISDSSVLVYLPRVRSADQTTVSCLPSNDDDEWLRMAWNKNSQPSYSIYDHQPQHLPSIIYRRRESIRDADDNPHELKRRRLV